MAKQIFQFTLLGFSTCFSKTRFLAMVYYRNHISVLAQYISSLGILSFT